MALVSAIASGCGDRQRSAEEVSRAPALAPAGDVDEAAIRYLERRVKDDPENFVAYNKLAGYYLQRMRENGSITYLDLAGRAARASLAALPAERNTGGLAMLAQVELAAHDFTRAREHGSRLRELDPGASFPLQILGDALLELGDYHGAASAFRRMARLVERRGESRLNLEMRLARLAFLHGQTDDAERRLSTALALALEGDTTPRETAAWCHWQLGEWRFVLGSYAAAEKHHRDALAILPGYFRALGGLARARAAEGDIAGAIAAYEHATRVFPDLAQVGALGDLYRIVGREADARAQYQLVEHIGTLGALAGALYDRQLALFEEADASEHGGAEYHRAAGEKTERVVDRFEPCPVFTGPNRDGQIIRVEQFDPPRESAQRPGPEAGAAGARARTQSGIRSGARPAGAEGAGGVSARTRAVNTNRELRNPTARAPRSLVRCRFLV